MTYISFHSHLFVFLETDVLKDCPAILSFCNCEDKEKAMAELISQKRKQNTNAANETTPHS